MISRVTEGACAFAWRNYLLLHSEMSENDSRRSALYRYVTNLRDTGEDDFDHSGSRLLEKTGRIA